MREAPRYVALVESFGAAGSAQHKLEGTYATYEDALAAAEADVEARRDLPGVSIPRASTVEEWQAEREARRRSMWERIGLDPDGEQVRAIERRDQELWEENVRRVEEENRRRQEGDDS